MAKSSTELKLFEALESYTKDDSFCSKASFVQNFLERDLDLNNTQQSIQIDDILEEEEEEEEATSEEEEESSEEDEDEDESSHISICSGSEEEEDEGGNHVQGGDPSGDANDKRGGLTGLTGKGREALLAILFKSRQQFKEQEENGEPEREKLENLEEEESVIQLEEEDKQEDDDESVSAPDGVENWSQYFQLLELKESLEKQQLQLNKQKESFEKVKSAEENRMKGERKRVETQRKSLQNLIADYHKIKFSKEDYEEKIKQLGDQLKETKLQMNKRISRWSDQHKRLEERVKILEKENEELKRNQPKSLPARLAALKRPPMRCLTNKKPKGQQNPQQQQPMRRVQFADDVNHEEPEETKENEKSLQNTSSSSSVSTGGKSPPVGAASVLEEIDDKEPQQKEIQLSDDEADKTMPSDYVEIKHPCGTITRVTKDNKLTRHVLINNDVMDEFEDCSVRYYYHELGFSQTTYPNGEEIIEYDSGEIETKRADGSKIYTYADGLVKMVDGNTGAEEVVFSDGSVVKNTADGECTITWPSGQKEVRTATHVKRIYTNGTVKIMYKDGSEETRYFNGRVRRKDKNGVLVDDTKKAKAKV